MQVSTRSPTDQCIADAVRVAPFVTHVIRQHGQLALMPPDNSTRSRKPKREKRSRQERQPRAHEEPHFNVGAPRTPRRGAPGSPGGRSRTNRRPDVSDAGSIPDYPPPTFDEAIAAAARSAPPLSPADSTTTHSSSPDRYQPVPILIPPLPRSQNQPVVTQTLPDPSSSESLRYSTQAEYDSGSDDGDLEVISSSEVASSPSTSAWVQYHSRLPIHERSQLESGTAPSKASARAVRSSPSQLTLTHHLGETLQDGGDDSLASSPSTDSQADDPVLGPCNSTPSPVPPKRRLHLLSGFLKSRDNHPASAPSTPTHAAASQLSLPLHFLNRPASPSKPHRAEGLISRKLFGHKGKDRNIDPQFERHSEPLETWDMLSDVEREFPTPNSGHPTHSVHSVPEHFPGTPGSSDAAARLLSPDARREGARPKHHSMLNDPVLPPPLLLTSATQRHANTHTELREAAVLASAQRQLTASAVSATASASSTLVSPSSPSQRLPAQSLQALLKPPVATDNPTRGRGLRATSSMIWAPGRRFSPVPSPTRSATTPTSPSMVSLQSGITNIDYGVGTPVTPVAHDNQESILGALPPSLVQEDEEEQFVTPPGSPGGNLTALPLTTISSRRPSPVRHEGRIGVTLRDDGPVPLGSPTLSEAHARIARTPAITPRPSVGALHAFAPPNPSPLAIQSFERLATSTVDPPRRDTVVSIGDTESLIELYVHSPGPTHTVPAACSFIPGNDESDQITPANSADSKQHHYPGRPLPHPPGASQTGPVRPVLLDLFLAGNVPAGLPPYEAMEPDKQRSPHSLSSFQYKQVSRAICLPPSPLVNQPGECTPPRPPPPALHGTLDDDASEPSSPGSTYEMSLSTPSASQHEFANFDSPPTRQDDGNGIVMDNNNRENVFLAQGSVAGMSPARLLRPSSLPPPMTRMATAAGMMMMTATTTTPTPTTVMTSVAGGAQYSVNGAPLGHIEVVRRRVTRNGRVKLKLVLLGATVDRCVICMTQFRDRESAGLGTRCQHAFHERCAGSWLARGNRTCPMCRTPFD